MTRPELLEDLMKRIESALRTLEITKTPGSITAQIHCDSTGPRKIIVTTEEAWSIRNV